MKWWNMKTLKKFTTNQNGSILVLFAVSFLLIILATGIAIDSWFRVVTKAQIQAALDSAVLAGASATSDNVSTAESAFMATLTVSSPRLMQSGIQPQFTMLPSGGMQGGVRADVRTFFLHAAGIVPQDVSVASTAEWGQGNGNGDGCIFLTDPSNPGLQMEGNSSLSADECTIQITTSGTAIRLRGNATATFEAICANGSIDASHGLTPSEALPECTPIIDPFDGLLPPAESTQACSTTNDLDVVSNDVVQLLPGVHCGAVTVEADGELELEPGVHVFKGGLDVEQDGRLAGEEVLLVFDRNIGVYTLDGEINVTGLRSGDFQGFVLYHEDFGGNSNQIRMGPQSSAILEGVIYIPNTNIIISSNVNELATRSILVTDRLEFSGNASFTAMITGTSNTPLPLADLGGDKQSLRLVK